jgi:hypothetical protein
MMTLTTDLRLSCFATVAVTVAVTVATWWPVHHHSVD